MSTLYYVLLMYVGAFVIGMFVATIIWFLVKTMTLTSRKKRSRQSFQEMKQIQ
jgi:hypothetical protein